MKVIPIPLHHRTITGVPDYYLVYLRWMKHYDLTFENNSKSLAYHYARVAEEMGQVFIEDDDTVEITLC